LRSLDVVVLPALGVPADRYARLCEVLRDHGLRAHVVDLDALTRPGGRGGHGYDDLVAGPVRDAVVAAAGDGPPLLLGHSLGGQVGLLLAAHEPDLVGGLALPAAGSVHWRDLEDPARAKRVRVAMWTVGGVTALLGRWPGRRMGFGGDQNGRLMAQWARAGRSGRWPATDGTPFDPARVTAPQLLVHVPGDRDAPASAARALVAGTTGPTEAVALPRAAFRRPRIDHLRWLSDPAPVAAAVAAWWAHAHADA